MHTSFNLRVCVAILALAALPVMSLAQTTTPGSPIRFQLQQVRQEATTQRCKIIESNIGVQTTRFNNNKSLRQNAYNVMQQKLQTFVDQATAQGANVSKVASDLATLKTKIDKFQTDFTAYMTALSTTQNYACGKSNGEFVSQLKQARTMLATIHTDGMDIRSFYTTTIRPDILALRSALKPVTK